MRIRTATLIAGLAAMLLAGASGAQAARTGKAAKPDEQRVDQARESTKDFARRVGEASGALADDLNIRLRRAAANPAVGWPRALVLLAAGLAMLAFGWALLKTLFLPLSVLVAAATGGFLSAEAARCLSETESAAAVMAFMGLGAVLGAVFCFILARKVRPLAWMLVVAAPFLILSVFLFPLGFGGAALAVAAAAGGLVLGFLATSRHRILVILSNSLLGAMCAASAIAMMIHLSGIASLLNALDWTLEAGWPVLVGLVLVMGAGTNFQLTFGPPDEAAAIQKRRQLTTIGRAR
jgi:hypothetical protein